MSLTSLLNKGFFCGIRAFRPCFTLDLATCFYPMIKKGVSIAPLNAGPLIPWLDIEKNKQEARGRPKGPKPCKTPYPPKKTLNPPWLPHACVRVCAIVCLKCTKSLFLALFEAVEVATLFVCPRRASICVPSDVPV